MPHPRLALLALILGLLGPDVAGAAEVAVDIEGFVFRPQSVTIEAGTAVKWTNLDSIEHTATSTTGVFDTGVLSQNQSSSIIFTSPGSHGYYCALHPWMVGTVNVTGGPGGVQPELEVGNTRVREGTARTRFATFRVRLLGPSTGAVQVAYATANGTARAGRDYRRRVGTLVFHPGELVKRILVRVIGDRRDERNEWFFLNLRLPVGATLADSRGRAVIVDNDG